MTWHRTRICSLSWGRLVGDTLEQFLARLHHPALAAIDLSLDRMLRLLSLLGSPQKRLPPVIHVAGTNGKGSLLIYIQEILSAAGYRVHRYTSPHLVHFSERIILNGQPIENTYLEKILGHVASVLPQQQATFFEATTAAAFLAFAEKPADVLLLETGMGGRLDATNVIAKPLLTAITPVSLDHTEFLGKDLASIAGEKAGIIKRGVPCVIGRQEPEALAVLEKVAASLDAPLYRLGHEWKSENRQYISGERTLPLAPALAGEHQYDNAATAVACLQQLPQFTISDAHIAQGLAAATWPARLQHIENGPYRELLPLNCELWLDGGHNPQGGQVLADWLAKQGDKDVYLICGMVKGKDTAAFLRPAASSTTALYAVAIPDEATSQPASAIAKAASGLGIEAHLADSVEKALQTIALRAKNPAIICICGSLYLAGKVLAANAK